MPFLFNYEKNAMVDVSARVLAEQAEDFLPVDSRVRFNEMVTNYKDDPIQALFVTLEEVFQAS